MCDFNISYIGSNILEYIVLEQCISFKTSYDFASAGGNYRIQNCYLFVNKQLLFYFIYDILVGDSETHNRLYAFTP